MNDKYSLYLDELTPDAKKNKPVPFTTESDISDFEENQEGLLQCLDVIGGFCDYLIARNHTKQAKIRYGYKRKMLTARNEEEEKKSLIIQQGYAKQLKVDVENKKNFIRMKSHKLVQMGQEIANQQNIAMAEKRDVENFQKENLQGELAALKQIDKKIRAMEKVVGINEYTPIHQKYEDYYAAACKRVMDCIRNLDK